MVNGIINIYKEQGYTSHDVVAKMRGILKMKKIGHTGTLDPDATGVLPVCIGNGTKLVDLITDRDKTYETVMKLGMITDTQDISGTVLATEVVTVSYEKICETIMSYVGNYQQLPPMYSAIKVNGKRLYELARQGIEIERERRSVFIKNIHILNYNEAEQEISMSVECSKGTYIRTLLHDIGTDLGCGGTMKSLTRTAVGSFLLKNAITLSQLEQIQREGRLGEYITTVEAVFADYDKIIVAREYHKLIYNGNVFTRNHIIPGQSTSFQRPIRVYDEDLNFIGIYSYKQDEAVFKPVKMFLN